MKTAVENVLERRRKEQGVGSSFPSACSNTQGEFSDAEADQVLGNKECNRRCGEGRPGGELLEPFDPKNDENAAEIWLAKIDQLERIHRWITSEKTSFMQEKLRSATRRWFNRQDNYEKSLGKGVFKDKEFCCCIG